MDRREFLMAAAGGGVLAFAPAAFAKAAFMDAQASRTGGDAVRIAWTAQQRPVSILMSSDPDASRQKMSVLKTGLSGASADLAAPVSPRPYFLLSTPDGAQVRVAERLLPLQGGRNFRDLGGYRAADGRQVRWGRFYRSGVMSGLSEADMNYLSALGVKVICDLRSNEERTHEPNPFIKAGGPVVAATDYEMSASSALAGLGKVTTREAAIDAFAAAYVQFTEVLTPQYTDMFARLKRGDAPLAFNCSAGKDRTGVAAALILSVLDVPRETILADYGLSQVYTPPATYMKEASKAKSAGFSQAQAQAFMRMPPEVIEVMLGSDPAVMRKALATIDTQFGGPVALVKARYGVSDADIAALRRAYLV
jgi:protein-tyrosine phosphatase